MLVSVTNFLLAKQGSLTEIRPTFLWTSSATAKQRAAVLGAYIVDNWQDATVHVVDSFESPGQSQLGIQTWRAFDRHQGLTRWTLDSVSQLQIPFKLSNYTSCVSDF